MPQLIDREDLLEYAMEQMDEKLSEHDIKRFPFIEIITCGECKHRQSLFGVLGFCSKVANFVGEDGFCDKGERE